MKEKQKNKSKAIIIMLAVIIMVLLGAGVTTGFVLINNSSDNVAQAEQGVVFDSNAETYNQTVPSDSSDTSGIKIPGYADMTVLADSTYFPITLLNPEGNPCNFKFTLSLKNTGEKLCTTDYVKPGNAIKGVTLDSQLKKGEYTLLISIATSALDTGASMNGAQVQVKLTVE